MKKLITLFFCQALMAQLNTNIVIISGAGNTNDNTAYAWDSATSYYTNVAAIRIQNTASNLWQLDGGYFSTNFPGSWYNVGFSSWPAPNPTGMFAGQVTTGAPIWTAGMTNFWTQPGDYVSFRANGRNMATTNAMTGLEVLLETNVIYHSTLTAGNGSLFALDGRLQWDGTNMTWFTEMSAGDPSNVQMAAFGSLTNYAVGTNMFVILPTGNTNGFILQSATVNASRAPQGAIAPTGTTTAGIGSVTFQVN